MKAEVDPRNSEIIQHGTPPSNWSTILTNGRYTAVVLYNGEGHSFIEHPSFNSIIKWAPKLNSQLSRFVYIKDTETEEAWCLNAPKIYNFDRWLARFGLGYLKIETVKNQIHAEITYFVPPDKDLEYWLIKIKNLSDRKRNLKIFSAVELSLGDLYSSILDPYAQELFVKAWAKEKILYATKTTWNNKTVFFSSDPKPESFDCLKSAFIGNGTVELPQAVKEGWCFESIALGREAIFAFQHNLEIEKDEEKEIAIALGVLNERTSQKININSAKDDYNKTTEFFRNELLNKNIQIETPDDAINFFINSWNKYQNWICFHWHRYSASNYVFGFEVVGYRDALQSILGMLPINPEICREKLLYLFNFQFKDGNTCHNFNPINNFAKPSEQSDDPLWLCIETFEYLKETGDFEFLNQSVRYYDCDYSEPIYSHIKKSLDFVLSLRGRHGLVLLRRGDWNDALNLAGAKSEGESTLASMLLLYTLNEWIKLNEFLKIEVENYKLERDALKNSINQNCWEEYKKLQGDGWFIRAISDDGEKIGSYFSNEGKIYLEPQIWAVLSDACDKERKVKCLNSAIKFLESTYGFLLLDPAYTKPNDKLGIITKFIAGEKENASFFMQTNAWAIMAFSLMRDVFEDKAFEIYNKTLPIKFLNNPRYKAEPFVYPQYICGKDSPHFGEASFTWLTSSSTWMFKAFVEYICGIKPDYQGLTIAEPAFPKSWSEVRIKRKFRGCNYDIKLKRVGYKEIKFDGKTLSENILPICNDDKVHDVEIYL